MSQQKVTAIVAYDLNKGIGLGGEMPWSIPEDLAHFKRVTDGAAVIMGRKTWESLPTKPLSGRLNVVVSSKCEEIRAEGGYWVVDPCIALQIAKAWASAHSRNIFVIGGSSIYEAMKDDITDLIVTEIPLEFNVDTYFPEIPGTWHRDDNLTQTLQTKIGGLKVAHWSKVE